MDLRAEPRFGTRSAALIEVIRDKVYTYNTTITEVSATGLRIEMTDELTVGESVRLLVNNYHIVCPGPPLRAFRIWIHNRGRTD